MPKLNEIEGCLIADRAKIYHKKSKNIFVKKRSTLVDRLTVILNSKRWIEKNLKDSFSINDLAKEMGMSLSQFQRTFKSSEGISVVSFIQQRRMARASELLKNSKFKISDICFEIGMASATTFSSLFKRLRGIGPKEVKKSRIE